MADLEQTLTRQRQEQAAKYWECRQKCGREFARVYRLKYGYTPVKPTTRALARAAIDALRDSRRPIRSVQSEYYSYCGLEDAQAMARDDAYEAAKAYAVAWARQRRLERGQS